LVIWGFSSSTLDTVLIDKFAVLYVVSNKIIKTVWERLPKFH
jgi:hypothetical protein